MTERKAIDQLQPMDDYRRDAASIEIARRLLSYLLAGNIEPGQKIPSERNLAEVLSVGRSIVREALKSLTLLGLVDVRQGDGTYLRRPGSELLSQSIEWGLLLGQQRTKDLVEARQHLEVMLAGLAAERRTEEEVAELRVLLDQMGAAANNPEKFVAADVAFHVCVAKAARNSAIAGVMSSIRSLLRVWISRVMRSSTSFEPSMREHAAVLEAIAKGDPAMARAAMQAHMDGAHERLLANLHPDEFAGAFERPGTASRRDD